VAGLLTVVMSVALLYQRISEARDAARFPAPGRLFDISGRKLHLKCAGSGTPTVVLEAGGASSSSQWGPLQERLAEFSHVCSYDRAGFGWSDPSPSQLSFDDTVRDLKALLTAAEIAGPYVLVGHSKGGLLVRSYARRYPEDVAGVLLLDATEEEAFFGGPDIIDSEAASARRLGRVARFGILRVLLRFFPKALPFPEIPEEVRPVFFSELARARYWEAAAGEVAAYTSTPPEDRVAGGFGDLGELPLIVMTHGVPFTGGMAALEPGFLEAQARLAGLSSNSELVVAEQSGHAIMWDEPDLVVAAVRKLISSTAG